MRRAISFLTILVLLLLSLSACRVTMPNADEQAELVKRKSFPNGGAPPWFTTHAANSFQSNGIIPNQLAPAAVVASQQTEVNYPTLVRADEINLAAQAGVVKETSALARVNGACPGNEKDVNAALTNEDRSKRIEQYQTLSQKCPMSADIYLWLANDYGRAGRNLDARTTYEHVLVLDPTNEEAKAGIVNVEKQMR